MMRLEVLGAKWSATECTLAFRRSFLVWCSQATIPRGHLRRVIGWCHVSAEGTNWAARTLMLHFAWGRAAELSADSAFTDDRIWLALCCSAKEAEKSNGA